LSGQRLKALRVTLGITTRDVQDYSRIIARTQKNQSYYISHSSLIDIENSSRTPSVFKLFTLSVVYRINFVDLLLFYGIDLEEISKAQLAVKLPKTHIIPSEIYDAERQVSFPVRFDPGARIEETNLLTRMVQTWGEIPIAFVQHLWIRKYLYGFIGLDDYTLHPMIRPGAFVQIDDQDNNVQFESWENEFDRPIYFFQLREGYACGWCQIDEKVLSIVPHSLSRAKMRHFTYPGDIDIVGRVVAVATPLPRNTGRSSLPAPTDKRIQ
jgi:transcriptional regulator with XRE-family HTH domain